MAQQRCAEKSEGASVELIRYSDPWECHTYWVCQSVLVSCYLWRAVSLYMSGEECGRPLCKMNSSKYKAADGGSELSLETAASLCNVQRLGLLMTISLSGAMADKPV